MTALERIREFISQRRYAYLRTFDTKSVYAQEVLADLAKFCRANESTFHADPRVHAVAEGRREVWLRITRHLNLTEEQLYALHGAAAPSTPRRTDDD